MKNVSICANLIAWLEGFEPYAKWDVNAWRLGFGSSTRGAAQTPVKRGDATTYADAILNLTARLPEFEETIVNQVGAGVWNAISPNGQAALSSFAYNYGELTPTLVEEVKTGDVAATSRAIADRAVDNAGINATRRKIEAAFFGSGG